METVALTLPQVRELRATLKTIPKFIADALEKLEKPNSSTELTLQQLYERSFGSLDKAVATFPPFNFKSDASPGAVLKELVAHGYFLSNRKDKSYVISLDKEAPASMLTEDPVFPLYSEMVPPDVAAKISLVHGVTSSLTESECNARLYELHDEIKQFIESHFNTKPEFIFSYHKLTSLLFNIPPILKWLVCCTTGENLYAIVEDVITQRGLSVQNISFGNRDDHNYCYVTVMNSEDTSYTYRDFTGNSLPAPAMEHFIIGIGAINEFIKTQPSPTTISCSKILGVFDSTITRIKACTPLTISEMTFSMIMGAHGYWQNPDRWGSHYHKSYVPTNPLIPTPNAFWRTLPADGKEISEVPMRVARAKKPRPMPPAIPTMYVPPQRTENPSRLEQVKQAFQDRSIINVNTPESQHQLYLRQQQVLHQQIAEQRRRSRDKSVPSIVITPPTTTLPPPSSMASTLAPTAKVYDLTKRVRKPSKRKASSEETCARALQSLNRIADVVSQDVDQASKRSRV